jgi:hypothetical protein
MSGAVALPSDEKPIEDLKPETCSLKPIQEA